MIKIGKTQEDVERDVERWKLELAHALSEKAKEEVEMMKIDANIERLKMRLNQSIRLLVSRIEICEKVPPGPPVLNQEEHMRLERCNATGNPTSVEIWREGASAHQALSRVMEYVRLAFPELRGVNALSMLPDKWAVAYERKAAE